MRHFLSSVNSCRAGVIFETLVEERVGVGWFHFDLSSGWWGTSAEITNTKKITFSDTFTEF